MPEVEKEKEKEEVVWGKTPSGQGTCFPLLSSSALFSAHSRHFFNPTVFRVPTTHDVVTALLHPSHPKSHLDILNLALLGLQLVLFCTTSGTI
ncbi:hypothetical protein VLF92_13170, partial [Pseudomonas chengduensis]